MRRRITDPKREGAIVLLVALCLIAMLGMVALAIDIGMVAVAKTQAQSAADAAAMAGTRTFNGQTGYNLTSVPGTAVKAAVANKIFTTAITGDPANVTTVTTDVYSSGNVKIECGGYYYVYNDANPSTEGFQLVIPNKAASEPYTAVRTTITGTSPVFFGSVFGANPFNIRATATAAHRPRDVVIIMDLSGSMRFMSCPGCYVASDGTYNPHWGPRNKSLNPESVYPQFGHYSATSTAALQGTTDGSTGAETVTRANYSSQYDPSGPSLLADFMSSGSTQAFTRSSDTYATTPGGDDFPKSGSTYIKTVSEYLPASPTIAQQETFSRSGYGSSFNGYTEGPGYWGKTFFMWPPDPRGSDKDPSDSATHADNGAKDWRQRFFFKKKTSDNSLYWLDHNNILFNPAGSPSTTDGSGVTPILKQPQDTTSVTENGVSVTYRYCINYAAVFQWLRNTTPTHFPSAMTSGRIKFYSKIPDPTGDSGFNNRFWTQSPMTDLSERFWKDYVDFMFGMVETGANTYDNTDPRGNPYSADVGSGDFYLWGTRQITQKADCNYTATVNNSGGYTGGTTPTLNLNNVKNLAGTAVNLPGPAPITGATNASPIVITSAGHGLANGAKITISGVTGNTAANGTWLVANVATNTFQIKTLGGANTSGNGTYTSAGVGAWVPAITGATNASPIVITTGSPHGLPTTLPTSSSASATPQLTVNISGVTGNTAANGKWNVTVLSTTTFSLNGSTGNGTFSSNATQWWEPVYFIRFGYASTFYELNPATTPLGALTGTPDVVLAADVANSTAVKIYTNVPKYMDYADNPHRPRQQFWFGPMTFADWLGNYTIYQIGSKSMMRWPGNLHEAQAWSCKIGISASIDDIKNNHPNDFVGMTFFSSPNYNSSGGGQHNMAVIPLGRNYQGLKDSLWFPPSTVSGGVSTITPYDSDFDNVPRAKGGTAPGMGFMIAFNLMSSSVTNLRTYATPTSTYRGYVGGLGRKGASRLVIFETDGAPNTRAYTTLKGSGSDSYYPIRMKNPTNLSDSQNEFPTGATSTNGYLNSEVYDVVKQICALDSASPPGFSTKRKPAQVYSLGYGAMFDPASTSNAQSAALDFLQNVQTNGNVGTLQSWQRIYGDNATRQQKMRDAFTTIMQAGVQVSMIE